MAARVWTRREIEPSDSPTSAFHSFVGIVGKMDMRLTKLRLKRVFRFEMSWLMVALSPRAWQVCREN